MLKSIRVARKETDKSKLAYLEKTLDFSTSRTIKQKEKPQAMVSHGKKVTQ